MRHTRPDAILMASGYLLLVAAAWIAWGLPAALTVAGFSLLMFGLGVFIDSRWQ